MLKSRQEIGNASSSLANESSDRKIKRAGIEREEALEQWFTKVREKYGRVTGPLLRLKAEELANNMGVKNDFLHVCIYPY